ncbi:hypothetical protein [Flavobacterium sp.]|uniref:hypothetical protein n=1 Tax=Flavobacterium sp. TaxID=239 RepID=UPI003750993E
METILTNFPNEEENKKLEDLFLAIYFNDLKKIIAFKNENPEIYSKKEKFLIDGNTNFDLKNLTLFNQKIWFDTEWRDEIMPLIEKIRQRTKQMLDFWEIEIGQKNSIKLIEYNDYWDYFYCDDPNDPDDNNEVIGDPISYFIEQGFKEIDVKLYNRVECFDFVEAKKLLEQGAKSDIDFYNDNDSSTIGRVHSEVSYLATCHVIPEFQVFENKGYKQKFEITTMFRNLLGLAAHQDMLNLLHKYYNEE